MATPLLTPVLENGIPNTHWFQGRVLFAEDLRTEQEANRTHRRHLGRAIGAGVVEGLQVRIDDPGSADTAPILKVTPGIALNPIGQDLRLRTEATVVLAGRDAPAEPDAGLFHPCTPGAEAFARGGDGAYLLVMGPASGFRERAPMSGIDREGRAPGCGSRYAVEGVQFRLKLFDPQAVSGASAGTRALLEAIIGGPRLEVSDVPRLSRYRNLLAHVSLGSEEVNAFLVDPFQPAGPAEGAGPDHGIFDHLIALGQLDGCDVPLALVHWSGDGLLFLDSWSARRQVVPHLRAGPAFLPTARTLAEGQARLAQFQSHLDFLLDRVDAPTTIEAQDYFHFLPPAGLLPIATSGRPRGFSSARFFTGLALEPPKTIPVVKLPKLLLDSLAHGPIALGSAPFVQLYEVAEAGAAPAAGEPFLVFAAVELPYIASAPRFDALCQTLRETRDAYRRLIIESDLLRSDATILNAIGEVATVATSWLAVCNGLTELDRAVAAMQDLYATQENLAATLRAQPAEIVSRLGLEDFARQLLDRLDSTTRPITALKPALDGGELPVILRAQGEINSLVVP